MEYQISKTKIEGLEAKVRQFEDEVKKKDVQIGILKDDMKLL